MVDSQDDLRSKALQILKDTAKRLGDRDYSPGVTQAVVDKLIESAFDVAWRRQFDTDDRQMFLDIRREVRATAEETRDVD